MRPRPYIIRLANNRSLNRKTPPVYRRWCLWVRQHSERQGNLVTPTPPKTPHPAPDSSKRWTMTARLSQDRSDSTSSINTSGNTTAKGRKFTPNCSDTAKAMGNINTGTALWKSRGWNYSGATKQRIPPEMGLLIELWAESQQQITGEARRFNCKASAQPFTTSQNSSLQSSSFNSDSGRF